MSSLAVVLIVVVVMVAVGVFASRRSAAAKKPGTPPVLQPERTPEGLAADQAAYVDYLNKNNPNGHG